jgi:hypothetical protein
MPKIRELIDPDHPDFDRILDGYGKIVVDREEVLDCYGHAGLMTVFERQLGYGRKERWDRGRY